MYLLDAYTVYRLGTRLSECVCVHRPLHSQNGIGSDCLQVKLLQAVTLREYTISRCSWGMSLSLIFIAIVLPGGGSMGEGNSLELLTLMV